MDQQVSQPVQQGPQYVMMPVRESNGLGVAGFFISLIGLFIPTGVVALLGLLISLVALSRPPRAFAAMGVLLGLFGTVLWLVLMIAAVLGGLAVGMAFLVFGAVAFILTQPETIEVTSDMLNVAIAVKDYEETDDALPQDLSDLGLGVSILTDPWGNPYRYQLVDGEPGFDVISGGGDGEFGTDDDVALSRLDRVWEDAFESFGDKMDQLGEKLERLQGASVRFERSGYAGFGCRRNAAARYEAAAAAATAARAAAAEAIAAPEPPEPPQPAEPVKPIAPAGPAAPASPEPDG